MSSITFNRHYLSLSRDLATLAHTLAAMRDDLAALGDNSMLATHTAITNLVDDLDKSLEGLYYELHPRKEDRTNA